MDVDGNYDARGWEPDHFLNSLTMQGDGTMRKGKLVTSGEFLNSFIGGLAEKTGRNLGKEHPLRDLASSYTVDDGKVGLEKCVTKLGDIGDISVEGFYSFDGGLSYNGTLLLSTELTRELLGNGGVVAGLGKLLKQKEDERLPLPLKIGGTIVSPTFEIDYTVLTKNLGENILQNLFKKKNN
jgi:hypothetical protein